MAEAAPKSKAPEEIEQRQTEVNKTSKRVVSLKQVEMEAVMVKDAVDITNETMDVTQTECEIADGLKKKFDELYGAPWQCVVGRKCGSKVTHRAGRYIYMHMGNQAIMLFKACGPD